VISKSIFERIGWTGLLKLVWKATPVFLRPFTLPYNLWVYGSFCRQSSNLRELLRLHDYQCHESYVYRLLRPRYSLAVDYLASYGLRPD